VGMVEGKEMPPVPTGVPAFEYIFLDLEYMLSQLRLDRRKWYVAELDLVDEPLHFFGDITERATTTRELQVPVEFKHLTP